ncbi:MobF family relaxase [Burkholderia pseudomallei]|uniref:MobF family relaxase n=1 Tax=Burkholderia pseudomallei TaxID=28450 RepID=UPI0022EAF0F2|nr:MobF family relaxase [Burkholderia pseudomallei]
MLSISKIKLTAEGIEKYHGAEGEHNALGTTTLEDYYNEAGAGGDREYMAAVWHGRGAERQGLDGIVRREDFGLALRGISQDGEMLVQNAGELNRRAAIDMTFSAPKSVSVIWGIDDRETGSLWQAIEKTQVDAVKRALDFYQRHAAEVRFGEAGKTKADAEIVAALFQHGTSRISAESLAKGVPPDVQLHTHSIVMSYAHFSPDGVSQSEPWMMKAGGVEALDSELRASARRSFEAWAAENPAPAKKYGFEGYVSYTQGKWAEEMRSIHAGEKSTAAMEFASAYKWKMALGAVYRVDQAWRLRELGLNIKRDGEFYEIRGVPRALRDELSKRTAEIEKLLAERNAGGGKANEAANLATRISKAEASFHEIQSRVIELAREHGFSLDNLERHAGVLPSIDAAWSEARRDVVDEWRVSALTRLSESGMPENMVERHRADIEAQYRERIVEIDRDEVGGRAEEQIAAHVLARLTETKSVFKEPDVYREVMTAAQGLMSVNDAERIAEHIQDQCIELQREFTIEKGGKTVTTIEHALTTPEMLQIETETEALLVRMALTPREELSSEAVRAGIDQFHAEKRAQQAPGDKPFALSTEQVRAIQHIFREQLTVLVGDAGTGKSTSVQAIETIHNIYRAEGYETHGVAPLSKAAAELGSAANIRSGSVERFLLDVASGKINLHPKSVVIVDEAGRVGARQMEKIVRLAEQAGTKLILMGDHKQTQAFAAGSPFRAAQRTLDSMGRKSSIQQLTQIIRQRSDDLKAAVVAIRDRTPAAALQWHLERGEVAIVKAEKDVPPALAAMAMQRSAALESQGKPAEIIILTRTNGRADKVNEAMRDALKQAGRLEDGAIYRTRAMEKGTGKIEIEISVRDRLIVTKNDNRGENVGGSQLKNGDTMTVVRALEGGRIEVHVDRTGELKEVEPENMFLKHGYAMTIDKSQGISPENILIWGTRDFSAEHAYVAESRARSEAGWVFSEQELNAIGKMAPVPDEWRKAVNAIEAERIAGGAQPSISDEDKKDFNRVYQYLEKHSPETLETGGPYPVGSQLNRIAHVLEALKTSEQKVNALDFKVLNDGYRKAGLSPTVINGVTVWEKSDASLERAIALNVKAEAVEKALTDLDTMQAGKPGYEPAEKALEILAPDGLSVDEARVWAEQVSRAANIMRGIEVERAQDKARHTVEGSAAHEEALTALEKLAPAHISRESLLGWADFVVRNEQNPEMVREGVVIGRLAEPGQDQLARVLEGQHWRDVGSRAELATPGRAGWERALATGRLSIDAPRAAQMPAIERVAKELDSALNRLATHESERPDEVPGLEYRQATADLDKLSPEGLSSAEARQWAERVCAAAAVARESVSVRNAAREQSLPSDMQAAIVRAQMRADEQLAATFAGEYTGEIQTRDEIADPRLLEMERERASLSFALERAGEITAAHDALHAAEKIIRGADIGEIKPGREIEPWMQKTGGVEALSPAMRESAQQSFDAWAERKPDAAEKYGLESYVEYVQEKWAESAEQRRLEQDNQPHEVENLDERVEIARDTRDQARQTLEKLAPASIPREDVSRWAGKVAQAVEVVRDASEARREAGTRGEVSEIQHERSGVETRAAVQLARVVDGKEWREVQDRATLANSRLAAYERMRASINSSVMRMADNVEKRLNAIAAHEPESREYRKEVTELAKLAPESVAPDDTVKWGENLSRAAGIAIAAQKERASVGQDKAVPADVRDSLARLEMKANEQLVRVSQGENWQTVEKHEGLADVRLHTGLREVENDRARDVATQRVEVSRGIEGERLGKAEAIEEALYRVVAQEIDTPGREHAMARLEAHAPEGLARDEVMDWAEKVSHAAEVVRDAIEMRDEGREAQIPTAMQEAYDMDARVAGGQLERVMDGKNWQEVAAPALGELATASEIETRPMPEIERAPAADKSLDDVLAEFDTPALADAPTASGRELDDRLDFEAPSVGVEDTATSIDAPEKPSLDAGNDLEF